jgi:hypothetical protein
MSDIGWIFERERKKIREVRFQIEKKKKKKTKSEALVEDQSTQSEASCESKMGWESGGKQLRHPLVRVLGSL